MSSRKTPLSASKRAVPIKIQVLDLSDGDKFPYTSLKPRWRFTMSLMPLTKIKELCIHAANQVQRDFGAVVDGVHMEARDRDGHVFHGMETISEEILNGETIFLVEGGALREKTAEDTGKEMAKGKDRGRLLSLRSEAEQAYRTPSVSSRSSSQSRKKARSQPKMTPSQRVLAIAQSKVTPKSEPWRARSSSFSAAWRQNLPPPPGSPRPKPAAARGEPSGRRDDAFSGVDGEATEPKQGTFVDPLHRDSHSHSPKTSPELQDSQKIVPDSQNSPSGSMLQPPPPSPPAEVVSTVRPKSNASGPSPDQPHPAPRLDTLDLETCDNPHLTTTTSTSRPDPYDISTVIPDEESHSPQRPSSIMSSRIRKLGGGDGKRPARASLPPMRQPQLNTTSLSHTSKSATADDNRARDMVFARTTTPTKKTTPTRIKQEASSPAAVLPSSPSNNVAAAIARGRDKVKRKPIPECVVIDESADEIDEELFRNPPGLSAPVAPSLETTLPWSQPPLRATQDPSLDVRPVPRRGPVRGALEKTAENNGLIDEGDVIDVTADVRRMIDEAKETLAAATDARKLRAKALPSSAISPFGLSSPLKTFPKTAPPSLAGRKPSEQARVEQPAVTIIRGSSSEMGSVGTDEDIPIIKEEHSDDDSWKRLPAAAFPCSPDPHDHEAKGKKVEVIELSSDSDSSIDPAWLDDFEAELPVINEPVPVDAAPRDMELTAPAIPAPELNNWETDPIQPSVNDESPPSAQPDKRKRSMSDEPDPEDEREKKRARRAEKKKVKKAMRKARYEEKRARLEEERKRLALEQAHRRALELEIIVSSPVRARQLSATHAELDDDSGLEIRSLDERKTAEDIGVLLDGDEEDDYFSREQAEDRRPWLHLSETPVSVSPSGRQSDPSPCIDDENAVLPVAADAHAQQRDPQDTDALDAGENPYYRRPFDDWAALEASLGREGFGYSPVEVHNRVHLAMVHSGLQSLREEQVDLHASLGGVKSEPEENDTKELPIAGVSDCVGSPTDRSQHIVKFKLEDDDVKEEIFFFDIVGNRGPPAGQDVGKAKQRKKGTKQESTVSSSKDPPKPTIKRESPGSTRPEAASYRDTLPAPQTTSKKGWKKGNKDEKCYKSKRSNRKRQRDRDRRRRHEMQRVQQYYSERRGSGNAQKKH